ncbi:hypothetical protein GM3708_3065 [Geminocystis sp. NIES-3708]|uniref:hypothetical protein n=1 Tax=Geminocystis sp. NIES-3708 TaxID=1615909 RepID=UPI0005FCCD5D|nr:hypothetical protein [Geminocystis sp. NIES-3708]BAQ62659.1 hypothetical protein GM3708_3065 [Geminocystis sp. NIES-3708]
MKRLISCRINKQHRLVYEVFESEIRETEQNLSNVESLLLDYFYMVEIAKLLK